MDLRPTTEKQKNQYNKLVTHVIQSWEWGEFRKLLGIPVLRYGLYEKGKLKTAFQLTLHRVPFTNQYVGYLPKGPVPDKELAQALKKIGREQNCAFIKIEPNVESSVVSRQSSTIDKNFIISPKPLFTKFNFILDLSKTEEELLKNMHPKTRYNIRVAQKHGVKVEESLSDQAFEIYLKLYFETTKRQGYHGHNEKYHKKVWETLKAKGLARLLIAYYQPIHLEGVSLDSARSRRFDKQAHLRGVPGSTNYQPLTVWMLLNFKDILYYPYGGSSKTHPEVMANNLVAWEAIKLGKKMGLKFFDMWGALGHNANPQDPWYGFHRFKQGYGGKLTEYLGTYDLVFNWPVYLMFTVIDKLTPIKVFLLKLLGK